MSRSTCPRRGARARLSLVLLSASVALLAGMLTLTRSASGKEIALLDVNVLASTLTGASGNQVAVWHVQDRGIAISPEPFDRALVIEGSSISYWREGRKFETVRYHRGGLWRTVRLRFGVTRKAVLQALRVAPTEKISSPLSRSSSSPTGIPPTFTKVDDYGTDVAALAKSAPFAVRYAGSRILGYSLADANISVVTNPYKSPTGSAVVANSGPLVTIVYSSKPQGSGVGDAGITLTLADRNSGAGAVNAGFLGDGRPKIEGKKLVAYVANGNQIVFSLDEKNVIGTMTSTTTLTVAQWRQLLDALRSI
jgi:hypothetical protein